VLVLFEVLVIGLLEAVIRFLFSGCVLFGWFWLFYLMLVC